MTEHRKQARKLVREGAYVAEVEVTLLDAESDHPWAPYLSSDDVRKLDEAPDTVIIDHESDGRLGQSLVIDELNGADAVSTPGAHKQ